MKRNLNATCGTCPYWHEFGECRRGAPKLVNGKEVWPHTYISEWCGQHPDFDEDGA